MSSVFIYPIRLVLSMYEQNVKERHISFTDSLLLALAKQQGHLLLTKDKRIHMIANELRVHYFDPQLGYF